MGLNLGQALRVSARTGALASQQDGPPTSVAFVGAGGKSTAVFRLARDLRQPTVVTTSTHLGAWQASFADRHIIVRSSSDLENLGQRGVTLITGPAGSDERLGALEPDAMASLAASARAHGWNLLVEADGARQKALKAPGPHEPLIPSFVDTVVVVAGLHGLGARIDGTTIHRPEIFASLADLPLDAAVTADGVLRVLLHERGGLKGIPPRARVIALLNQADSDQLQAVAGSMAPQLLETYSAVVIADLQGSGVVAVHEPLGGVVLAAGGATRFGSLKQLSVWQGETFVHRVARIALESGLRPVVVVTGAHAQEVEAAVKDLPVLTRENAGWQAGQSSSVRAGVESLPPHAGGAAFLLADQPLVTTEVVRALVEAHATLDACILAPMVEESRRANPVLFDRQTFDSLRCLQGDVGGRGLFQDYRVDYVPWHDTRIAYDVDTQGDYQGLLEEED